MSSKEYPMSGNSVQRTEEEDAHLCLRCHTTIMGLHNYVAHRQNPCHQMFPVTEKNDGEIVSYEKKYFQEKTTSDSSHGLTNQSNKSKDYKKKSYQILDKFSNLPNRLQEHRHPTNLDNEEIDDMQCHMPFTVPQSSKELQGDRNFKMSFSANKSNDLHSLTQTRTNQSFPELENQSDLSQTQLQSQNINSSLPKNNLSSSHEDVDHYPLDSSNICLQGNNKTHSILCKTSLSQNRNLHSPPALDTSIVAIRHHLIHHKHEESSSLTNESRSIENLQTAKHARQKLNIESRNKDSSGSLFPSYENKVKQILECQSQKLSQAQTPFTSFTDPLLLHTQNNSHIFRQFEGFVEQGKTCQVGSPIAPTFPKASTSNYEIENPKPSYDLESHNFESRYQEFYSIQSSSQDSLLSPNQLIDISDKRNSTSSQEVQSTLQVIGCMPDPNVKRHEVEMMEYQSSGDLSETEAQLSAEYQPTATTVSSQLSAEYQPATTADMVKDEVLRQDDFLSSLELRSRPKILTKQPNNEEEEEEEEDDEMRPPSHHTGGKWRPGLDSPISNDVGWRSCPPRSEVEDEELEEDHDEEDDDLLLPPPSYTKGKWLPGKRITNKGSSTYGHYCHPCDRKLRDQNTYHRHLQSQLHFINQGKANAKFEASQGREDQNSTLRRRPVRLKRIAAERFLKNTIAQLKSKKLFVKHEITNLDDNKKSDDELETPINECQSTISKESSKKEVKQESSDEEIVPSNSSVPKLMCPICRLSFGASYVSLHFASLAHIHNELEQRHEPTLSIKEEYNNIIIKYIDEIVKTSYFKCNVCKFYCNLHDDLYEHMTTHNNETTESELKNLYTCSSCQDENAMQIKEFLRHLKTPHHKENAREEVLLSHQVMVDRKTAVTCPLCNKLFRYFHAYRRHRRMFHEETDFQLSHQRLLRCPECNFQASDYKLIRTHLRENHEDQENNFSSYYCFVCGLGFKSLQEAEVHRRSVFHRTTVGRQKGLSVARTCNMCYEHVPDLASLRAHMVERHSSECSPCHVCGHVPPLRADLAQHQRNCKGEVSEVNGTYKCQLCPFKNNLLAHVLSHTTLSHGTPDSDTRYPCHICKTKLRATSVKGHMLSHSNEWPHGCHLCSRKFPRQEWLTRHLATVHHRGGKQQTETQMHQLCHLCGATHTNRSHLKRHLEQHHGHALLVSPKETISSKISRNHRFKNNTEENSKILCHLCGHQADSPSYMKIHMRGHRGNKGGQLECPHCNYITGHLPHLRRHLRLHTGATPFVCPYCPYECNNQENLRKHMLKTKLHPGRFMYECRLCIDSPDFKTSGDTEASQQNIENQKEVYIFKSNYSKELHSHLLQHHHNHFSNKEQVTAHIRSYYHPESDITVTNNPKPYLHKKRKRTWGPIKNDCVAHWADGDVTTEDVPEDDGTDFNPSKMNEREQQPDQYKQLRDNHQTILHENLPNVSKISVSNQMMKIRILDSNGSQQTPPQDQKDNSDTLLKQVKQILKDEQIANGDQNSCPQVIMIVPDDIVSTVGDLANLLPTLGLPSSLENVSVLTLHTEENQQPKQDMQERTEIVREQNFSLVQLDGDQLAEFPSKAVEICDPSKTILANHAELKNVTKEQSYNECCEINDMSQIPKIKMNDLNTKLQEINTNKFIIGNDNNILQSKEIKAKTRNQLYVRDKEDNGDNMIMENKVPYENETPHTGSRNVVKDGTNICENSSISPAIPNLPQLTQGGMFVLKRNNTNTPQNLSLKNNNDIEVQHYLGNQEFKDANSSQALKNTESEYEIQSIVLVENAVFDTEDTLIIHENLEFPPENTEIMQKGTHLIREVSIQPSNSYQGEDNISKVSIPNYVERQQKVEYDDESSRVIGHESSSMISIDEVSQAIEVVTSDNNCDGSQVIYTFTL